MTNELNRCLSTKPLITEMDVKSHANNGKLLKQCK